MAAQPLISLQGVKKVFYTEDVETSALDQINVAIDQGEYVSISGPSGCGKSTLLSVMGLLHSATEGKYVLNGVEVTALSPAEQARVRNREIGFIFQAFNLIPDMSAFENIELPLTFRDDLDKKQRQELVVKALDQVNMSERTKHFPAQMSGGQQQRVAIARALVGRPKVLLADEPTGNLDSKNAELIMKMLAGLHEQGSTIVMVTHDLRFADRAERQVSLFDGKIVDDRSLRPNSAVTVA
ncbi:MAG: ABC transporter ATP-binding protein [Acidobacteriota bacterium]